MLHQILDNCNCICYSDRLIASYELGPGVIRDKLDPREKCCCFFFFYCPCLVDELSLDL